MRFIVSSLIVTLALVLALQAQETGAKRSIKEVMKAAHGGGKNSLLNQVIGGNASLEQQKMLLSLYEDLAKNAPKKGNVDGWKQKTGALVKAALAATKGEEGAGLKLKGLTSCTGCHGTHK